MKREPVTGSSTLKSVGHENGVMHIEFKDGRVYEYTGPRVTEHHTAMMAAPSKGVYFMQQVRNCKKTKCNRLPDNEPSPAP